MSRWIVPSLEVLEDRCLLSAATTVPALTPADALTGLADFFLATLPKDNPSIVFLGDSLTWSFAYNWGASVWSALWAPAGAADYGIIGQSTRTLLYQLSLGQLVGIHPSVVVLTIGTNNLAEGDSPQATAAGIVADVHAIEAYLPAAQIVVLGVPPGGASPADPYRLQVSQTNSLVIQMLAGDSHAMFVNIAPALEQADGTISSSILADYIHPTLLGYFDLTEALAAPVVEAYLLSQSRSQPTL
ncbi:MAG TPA: GDSL-type esterase/lipase family protein [Gemmataceae bacterium]|nr:GDSL-type esterase/lipase family protein [Gemmataceae bacterium]